MGLRPPRVQGLPPGNAPLYILPPWRRGAGIMLAFAFLRIRRQFNLLRARFSHRTAYTHIWVASSQGGCIPDLGWG